MCQFKFLIVEDELSTLKQLEGLIREDFPESMIDIAATAVDGREFLRCASSEGRPYDALILDFRLPQEMGDEAKVDTSLSREARRSGHPMLVAQITSYANDQVIEEHLQKTQIEQPNPNCFLVDKRMHDWSVRLVGKLRTFLYGRHILREVDELFGDGAGFRAWGRGRNPSSGGLPGGMTHRLATLCRIAEAHWNDLEVDVKQRIRDILEVDESESSTKPKVGLLLEDPWIERNLSNPSDGSP